MRYILLASILKYLYFQPYPIPHTPFPISMPDPLLVFTGRESAAFADEWDFPAGVTYLNHGSFGPPPRAVVQRQQLWREQMNANPMAFFDRELEPAWFNARDELARFVGATPGRLVFQENSTAAMNAVARTFPLSANDEIALTDHEYGAVVRIWERKCAEIGATPPRVITLTTPFTTAQRVVANILEQVTSRTKLVVISHITSATAVTLPLAGICAALRIRGIAVCVDGPHAVAQLDLALDSLDCDFYAASCHKWLSAPFGSGFLYVHPRQQQTLTAPILSWGRVPPAAREIWADEFLWPGTRDPSPYLTVPAAIEFLRDTVGLARLREQTHALARHTRQRLESVYRRHPLIPDDPAWYGTMALVELPPGEGLPIKRALWEQFGIECPVVNWNKRRFVRVSCHLYNTVEQVERLVEALTTLVPPQ